MGFTLLGLISLSQAHHFYLVLISVGLVGVGSSIFHPEASRLAYMASGGKHGMAQSLFQLGGNAGSSLGPLLAAMIIVPKGQSSISWFSLAALLAIVVMINIGSWYKNNTHRIRSKSKGANAATHVELPKGKVIFALGILLVLIFSKYFYMASMTSYYTFYLMDKFHVSVQSAQVYLFIFLFAIAAGTFIGGPVGDRIGRKYVIWISILGVAPFSLLLPHANLLWTSVLSVFIGVILSSAFSAILVYAQELVPGKVGMIAGLFFGLAFGMGGIGSALLGKLADRTSIAYVFDVCAYLPLIGLLTGLLPNVERAGKTK
jgi:FSR family fosmidomycin resistance protein-like MFS transporter